MAEEQTSSASLDQAALDALLATAVSAAETPPAAPPQTPAADSVAQASAVVAPDSPLVSPSSASPSSADPVSDLGGFDAASIEELLRQAQFEDPSTSSAATDTPGGSPSAGAAIAPPPPTHGFSLPNFQQVMQDAQASSIDLLRDVELNVKIELGRSRMLVEDVLRLSEGSVVELDKLAGDPVDVFVNDKLVARGEVLVLNDNFCVRVNEIVAGAKEEGL